MISIINNPVKKSEVIKQKSILLLLESITVVFLTSHLE